jgi:sensor histidine kinase YesM
MAGSAVGQELTFTHRYLEIMQIRFQGRLTIQSQVEPGVLDALVPNLILQPLVENAIKHGEQDRRGRPHRSTRAAKASAS